MRKMDIKTSILREEAEFPKLFTNFEEREYGILFHNTDAPTSQDSNHAILYPDNITDFRKVLLDIKDFYQSKRLTPRIYQPFVTGYFADRKDILDACGYTFEIFGINKIMLLSGENTIDKNKRRLDIRRITEWNERLAADVYIPSEEEYAIQPTKNSLKYDHNYFFAGWLGDEIAAVVNFCRSEYNCTRFEYILTAEKHRGNGYAREILSHAVEFCKQHGFPNCYQWPAHETSERLCYDAGFRTLFEFEGASAEYIKGGGL
jgi:GNAT superfamily N-acetyltransferase